MPRKENGSGFSESGREKTQGIPTPERGNKRKIIFSSRSDGFWKILPRFPPLQVSMSDAPSPRNWHRP
jgi:hypothetical protein